MLESEKSSKICLVNIQAEKIGELAHDVYKDLAQPAVKTTGKILNLGARGILAFLSPYEKYVVDREHSIRETSLLLEKKLEHIPKENIVAPPSYIAVPTLQAISYSADSQALRELFANLLATSMNIDTQMDAHPAFVEIIKQLSPMEAKILKETNILKHNIPYCTVRFQKKQTVQKSHSSKLHETKNPIFAKTTQGSTILNHLVLFGDSTIDIRSCDLLSAYVDNFIRLGLCLIPPSRGLANEKIYERLATHPALTGIKARYLNGTSESKKKTHDLYLIRGVISPTEFGKFFYESCIKQ